MGCAALPAVDDEGGGAPQTAAAAADAAADAAAAAAARRSGGGAPMDAAAAAKAVGAAGSDEALEVRWERGTIFDRGVATLLLGLVRAAGTATLASLTEAVEPRRRPPGLNTVMMLKTCSKALGIGAERAMRVAEALYLGGYLSYPRTESTAYPKGFDFAPLVEAQAADPEWGAHARWLLEGGRMDTAGGRGGVDAGDRRRSAGPPRRDALMGCGGLDAVRVYALVARTFLASISPDAAVRVVRADFEAGGERFGASGTELLEEGGSAPCPTWRRRAAPPRRLTAATAATAAATGAAATADTAAATGERRRRFCFASLDLIEGHTAPPGPLSEAELIGLMEAHGIGTDASIPSHIGTIEARKYVRLVGGRRFEPTALGMALIDGVEAIDGELVQPTVRAHVEAQLELIAAGRARRADVVRHVLGEFEAKFAFLAAHVGRLTHLLEETRRRRERWRRRERRRERRRRERRRERRRQRRRHISGGRARGRRTIERGGAGVRRACR